jgi:hypothetical protein
MVKINPMEKIDTPDGTESRPRCRDRNKIRGYRRQDERPVRRTQDLTPTERQDRSNADKCKDDPPEGRE